MKHLTSIDAYIRSYPKEIQSILQRILKIIRKAAPQADESISYGMPGFKLNGKPLVYFGAWKHHIGFYATPSGNAAFKKEIAPYKGAKGSIQFPLDEAIPYNLIRRITAYRVNEVIEQAAKKGKLNTCSRGHQFSKSSDCPVCPKCWPGYYRKRVQHDVPTTLGAPALRALAHAKIKSLAGLAKHTEAEIAALHGMGPKGIRELNAALRARKIGFRKPS